MPRSAWKPVHVCAKLLKQTHALAQLGGPPVQRKPIRTASRSSMIIPQFLGMRFQVYNGKDYVNVKVKSEMVGHKLWEFVPTRKRPIHPKGIAESKGKGKRA